MKRLFITAMLSIAAAGTALAADLPQPAPVQAPVAYIPTVAPVYNWGGIYVGINGGWGLGQSQWTASTRPAHLPQERGTPVTTAAWSVVPLEPIFRLENSYSGWKAIGTIPPSTPALP